MLPLVRIWCVEYLSILSSYSTFKILIPLVYRGQIWSAVGVCANGRVIDI